MKLGLAAIAAFAVGIGISGLATGQSMQEALGEFEFMNSCATCHGADGKGNGSISGYLNTTLPDLSRLQANNGGIFPVTAVFKTIELGPDSGPHGTRDMPAWGLRYRMRADTDPDFIYDRDSYAKLRVLALIEYLATIQEE